ncbi:hypothetical protein ACFQ0B_02490 [Nonomuraea thailandensis]
MEGAAGRSREWREAAGRSRGRPDRRRGPRGLLAVAGLRAGHRLLARHRLLPVRGRRLRVLLAERVVLLAGHGLLGRGLLAGRRLLAVRGGGLRVLVAEAGLLSRGGCWP